MYAAAIIKRNTDKEQNEISTHEKSKSKMRRELMGMRSSPCSGSKPNYKRASP